MKAKGTLTMNSTVNLVLLHRGGKRQAREKQPPGQRQFGFESGALWS